ncbi:MAG: hypothetical protein WCF24_03660, partial [Acidimicrobiales bacterium]
MPDRRTARVAVGPDSADWAIEAIRAGGGESTTLADAPNALVWVDFSTRRASELKDLLAAHPSIEWVQLPVAGVERFVEAGVIDAGRIWTSAKA